MLSVKIRSMTNMILTALTRPKIDTRKVFVMTYDNKYSCNPAAIAEELMKADDDIRIVWATGEDTSGFPSRIKTVRRGSREMFKEMRTSHIWLDNGLNCVWYFMPKRKGQIYINTWHGSLGIKKLGGNKAWKMRAGTCRKKTDCIISGSRFEEEVYDSTYWKGVPCLRLGHARNAVLFCDEKFDGISSKVRHELDIDQDVRIALYAPTFRDNGNTDYPKPDWSSVTEALSKRFGGRWIIAARLHMKDRDAASEFAECVKDASGYPDMAELMIASDAGITDYSSWIFDYIHLGRPAFIYAPDRSYYESSRGLYYPLSDTPFAVSEDADGLCSSILDHDDQKYGSAVRNFLKEKECYDDRDSAVRAAQFILDNCSDIV